MAKTPAEYFGRFPNYFGTKSGLCDLLWMYGDKPQWYPGNGCHGQMAYLEPTAITKAYSSLWVFDEKQYDDAVDYWKYLLDPQTSPYKAVLKDVEWVMDAKGRPLAFGVSDRSAPLQLIVGLMMQVRIPQEQTMKLRTFANFKKAGFENWEALYISEHIFTDAAGKMTIIGSTYNHGFTHTHIIDPKKIRDATPSVDTSICWSKGARRYTPITAVWGGRRTTSITELLKVQEKYVGNFGKAFAKLVSKDLVFKDSGIVPMDEAVKVLKEKRSEWIG